MYQAMTDLHSVSSLGTALVVRRGIVDDEQNRRAMSVIDKLGPDDAGRVTEHLLRLGRHDRQLRFGSDVGDAYVRQRVADIDWDHDLLVGYVEDGSIRGLAQLMPDQPFMPKDAEVAFSIEPGWRQHGLGHQLMAHMLEAAAMQMIQKVHLYIRCDNVPMRRIAARNGFSLTFEEGEYYAATNLAAASPADAVIDTLRSAYGAVRSAVTRSRGKAGERTGDACQGTGGQGTGGGSGHDGREVREAAS